MLYALNALTDISLCCQGVLSGNNQYWTCLGMRWHVHCRGEWGCLVFSRSSLNIQTITDHWTMCFLLMTLVVQKLCVNIYVYVYMYVHSLYEFCYRSYIQWECHSVLARLQPVRFCGIISGECAVPGLNATFCFLWFTNYVLLFDKSLILGCLWPLVFVFNNMLILGIWCSTFVPGPSLRISDSTQC